jgi:hypothetical protein
LSHPLAEKGGDSFFPRLNAVKAFPDTFRVFAIMVQFQKDNDSRTTGAGEFDSLFTTAYGDTIIDPLPHNRQYFQNHLTFLENYFRKVSDGKAIVKGEVFDRVFTLPNRMQNYSPARNAPNNEAIGRLIIDAWRLADSLHPEIDFSKYQAFIIFHAGVGRDINLTDEFGFDPTPFDIPSLYIGLNGLKSFFGSSYRGIPVDGGRVFITNSAIIPETENREITGITGTALLQLGINGLIVGSFGSFLGLPDLFDTKT